MKTCAIVATLAAALSVACKGSEEAAPVAQSQSQTAAQPAQTPVTVTGCLRAGEAADTFVLTADPTGAREPATTYQLAGREGVDFRSNVGRRVEMSGVVAASQRIAGQTLPAPTPGDRATGTAGTPTVETRTEVQIRQLRVESLRPIAETCED
jgi:hypothetical protein